MPYHVQWLYQSGILLHAWSYFHCYTHLRLRILFWVHAISCQWLYQSGILLHVWSYFHCYTQLRLRILFWVHAISCAMAVSIWYPSPCLKLFPLLYPTKVTHPILGICHIVQWLYQSGILLHAWSYFHCYTQLRLRILFWVYAISCQWLYQSGILLHVWSYFHCYTQLKLRILFWVHAISWQWLYQSGILLHVWSYFHCYTQLRLRILFWVHYLAAIQASSLKQGNLGTQHLREESLELTTIVMRTQYVLALSVLA